MNFLFKVLFIIAVYGAGFYMGLNYEGGEDHVEDTLDHLNELKSKGLKQGTKLLKKIKED